MNEKIHIVPSGGEWAIRLSGSDEPAAVHPTQQAAIENAMELAREAEMDLVIHRQDGTFRNVIHYDTIERRSGEGGVSDHAWAWRLFAAGALAALGACCVLWRSAETRRLLQRLEDHRPEWLRAS